MRLFFACLCLLSLPFFGCAQNDFKPAYIVKSSGDTIKGFIQEGNEKELSSLVHFKNDVNQSTPQSFRVDDIAGFGFNNGNIFVKVSTTDPTDGKQKVIFAKFLVSGYYRLYSFFMNDHRYFMLKNKQDSTYLLYDDIYTVPSGFILQNGNYKNVLAFVAGSCENLRNSVQNVGFAQSDVIDFVKDVNDCVSPASLNQVLFKKPKAESYLVGYVGGLYTGKDYEVTARIFGKFTLPAIDNKTQVNIGVNFMRNYKKTKYNVTYLGLPSVIFVNETVGRNIITIPATLQYNFTTTKLRPYLEAGLSIDFTSESGELDVNLTPTQAHQNTISLVAAGGIEYNVIKNLAIKAEIRYEFFLQYPTLGIAYTF